MQHWNTTASFVARVVTGAGLVAVLASCGGASSSTDQPALSTGPIPNATPAPGSERVPPDPHPELAHLTAVTVDSLAQAIKSYVDGEAAREGGVFPVADPDRGTRLGLTLTTVHRERLSRLADGRYFACADFRDGNDQTYDIDLFMRADSTGLVPTELIVHKVNGTARFNWTERDGVWSRTPVPR